MQFFLPITSTDWSTPIIVWFGRPNITKMFNLTIKQFIVFIQKYKSHKAKLYTKQYKVIFKTKIKSILYTETLQPPVFLAAGLSMKIVKNYHLSPFHFQYSEKLVTFFRNNASKVQTYIQPMNLMIMMIL